MPQGKGHRLKQMEKNKMTGKEEITDAVKTWSRLARDSSLSVTWFPVGRSPGEQRRAGVGRQLRPRPS